MTQIVIILGVAFILFSPFVVSDIFGEDINLVYMVGLLAIITLGIWYQTNHSLTKTGKKTWNKNSKQL